MKNCANHRQPEVRDDYGRDLQWLSETTKMLRHVNCWIPFYCRWRTNSNYWHQIAL